VARTRKSATAPIVPIRLSRRISSFFSRERQEKRASALSASPSRWRPPVTTADAATAAITCSGGPKSHAAARPAAVEQAPTRRPTTGKAQAARATAAGSHEQAPGLRGLVRIWEDAFTDPRVCGTNVTTESWNVDETLTGPILDNGTPPPVARNSWATARAAG
jgi:hypothetical protein